MRRIDWGAVNFAQVLGLAEVFASQPENPSHNAEALEVMTVEILQMKDPCAGYETQV